MTGYTVTVTDLGAPATAEASLPGVFQGTVDFHGMPGAPAVTWVLVRMPDGMLVEGRGASADEAMADARRNWAWWRRGHPAPLAVNGREYHRRRKARQRRR